MKVAIRLQNHGCANHPYWWIVIAPNRKNIRGRIIEHVGYWSPRHGVSMQRQIILNIPRIKHWISCGAVPTYRIQRFLSLWNILPKPWYYKNKGTQQQMAALKKPESEMTDKQKMKQQKKKKKRQREKASPLNYYKHESKFKAEQFFQFHKYRTKLKEKIQAAEYENQILRELLVHNEYYKINRINELSGNVVYDDTQELVRLEQQLTKAKAELALIDKSFQNASIIQKIKVMREINNLVDKIREVERQRKAFRQKDTSQAVETQNITKMQVDKKLQYELVIKRIEKMNQEMVEFEKLCETVTLEEYANYLVVKQPDLDPQNALDMAQEFFILRGKKGLNSLTKWELQFQDEFLEEDTLIDAPEDVQDYDKFAKPEVETQDPDTLRPNPFMTKQEKEEFVEAERKVTQQNLIKILMARPDVLVPTNRPVHPFPDFNTYVPEEYYDPITHIDIAMTPLRSIEPKQELQKYHQKKEYKKNEGKKVKVQKIEVEKRIKRTDHIL